MHTLSPILDYELSPSSCGGITTATGTTGTTRDLSDVLRGVAPKEFVKTAVIEGAYFLYVVDGLVQAYRDLPNGNKMGLGIYGPGACLFGTDRVRVLSKTAEVMAWDRAEFARAVLNNDGPAICIAFLSAALQARTNWLVTMASGTKARQLAALLLDLAARIGTQNKDGGVTIPGMTHDVLSSELGTTREIVTGQMNTWRLGGVLHYDRKAITVYPDKLRKAPEVDHA